MGFGDPEEFRQRTLLRLGVLGQESGDYLTIFLAQNGAGRIEKDATGGEEGPSRFKDGVLGFGQSCDVLGLSEDLDVRMSSNDPGC